MIKTRYKIIAYKRMTPIKILLSLSQRTVAEIKLNGSCAASMGLRRSTFIYS